jgi:integrase/recombinase XerD
MSAVLKVVPTAVATTNKQRKPTNYGGLLLRGGTWHMRFTIKGQTVAESTHTSKRQEAERILAKRRSELVQEVVLAGKKPIKLHDGIDAFVASRSHMPSHQNCAIHIGYFKAAPNHYLDRVTDAELQAVIQAKRNDGYKESTLKVSVSYFNAMIKFLDEQGYTVRKKLKPIKHDSGKIVWMTKDELARLYAQLDPSSTNDAVTKAQKLENFDLVRLLYETGCRLSEIKDMTWSQVDLAAGTVYVRRLKGSISNTINMTKLMREILTRRRATDTGDHVFASKQLTDSNPNNRWFNGAVKRAQLDQSRGSITLHTLRHSRAVHLLQAGLGLLELKTYLGHRSIQSTMVYAHVAEQDVMRKAVALTDN